MYLEIELNELLDLDDVINSYTSKKLDTVDKIMVDYDEGDDMSEEAFLEYENRIDSLNDDIIRKKEKIKSEVYSKFNMLLREPLRRIDLFIDDEVSKLIAETR